MCKPKTPKVEKVPVFQSPVLPDGGDPSVRGALRGQRRLMRSAMMFSTASGGLGSTLGGSVANPGAR